MNVLAISADFDAQPSDDERRPIDVELRRFLNRYAPAADVSLRSGGGSWWIVALTTATPIVTWLALEVASWGVGRALDKARENPLREATDEAESADIELPSAQGTSSVVARNVGTAHSAVRPNFELLASLGAEMGSISERIGARRVTVGEWSDSARCGRVVDLVRSTNGLDFSMFQTDSRDEFNSRTDPATRIVPEEEA